VAGNALAGGLTRADNFLSAYVQWGGTFQHDRLNWYCACALTRLFAMHVARAHRPASLDLLRQLAERCLDALEARTDGCACAGEFTPSGAQP